MPKWKRWLIGSLLIVISSNTLAKDYFGFNLEKDTVSSCQHKLEQYWIDWQQASPQQLQFKRSGLLRLIANYIAKGELSFDAQQHLTQITVIADIDSDRLQRLVDHLNEDYDFDKKQPLSTAQFITGSLWQQTDIRSMQWQFAVNGMQVSITVKR